MTHCLLFHLSLSPVSTFRVSHTLVHIANLSLGCASGNSRVRPYVPSQVACLRECLTTLRVDSTHVRPLAWSADQAEFPRDGRSRAGARWIG